MKSLLYYYPILIIICAASWPSGYISTINTRASCSTLNLTFHGHQDTSGLQASNFRFPVRQDTDTIVLDEIQINRPLFNADSLQVHHYFKTLSQKTSPSWKSIFIERTTSNKPILPNRANSTSSLISIDLLSVIGMLTKKKRSAEQDDVVWNYKERYIEQHFDSTLVKSMTGLSGADLQEFVRLQRPSANDLSDTVLYEVMKYIKSKHDD